METILTSHEGVLKRTVIKSQEADKIGIKLPNKTVLKETGVKSKPAKLLEVWTQLRYAHERMDKMEDILKAIYTKIDHFQTKLASVEDVATGKDPKFEAALRHERAKPVILNASQKSLYGAEAPAEIQEIVTTVLGADVCAFMQPNRSLPSCLLTLLIPKRLSGQDMDFRSSTVYNASIEGDVKKWCERVKSNLYRTYQTESKGTPHFLIH